MFEKFSTVTVAGREFKLVFTLAAMAQVVERFGSVSEMSQTIETNQAEAIRTVPWLFSVLANQGLWHDANGTVKDLITEVWAGSHIMPSDVGPILAACNLAMMRGLGMEHKTEGETVDVVLEDLQKNVMGAEA